MKTLLTLAILVASLMPTHALGDWYRLVEVNAEYGESWIFYIDLTAGEHTTLAALVTGAGKNKYYLSTFSIAESLVDSRTTSTFLNGPLNYMNKVASFTLPTAPINWSKDPFAMGAPWTLVPYTAPDLDT